MKPEIPNGSAEWTADLANPVGEWRRLVETYTLARDLNQTLGVNNISLGCLIGGREFVVGTIGGAIPLDDDGRQQLEAIKAELEVASGQTFPSVEEVVLEIDGSSSVSLPTAGLAKMQGFPDVVAQRVLRKLAQKRAREKWVKGSKLAPKLQRRMDNLSKLTGWCKGVFYRNGRPQKGK